MATSRHQTRFELTATDKTRAAIKSAETGFKQLDGMVSRLSVGVAGLAGAGGIGLLITSQIEGARQARAYSDALGLNIETLTSWQAASQTVGIQADKMADIFKDVSEKIGDAFRNDAGEAKEALQSLNLSISEMVQLSPDQQLLRIAGALNQVSTQAEKIQIMEALASDAALLLPLLDNNASKLKEIATDARATGAALTEVEADKLLTAGEAMADLKRASEGLSQTLAVTLAQHLTNLIEFADDIVEKFSDAEDAVGDFFDQFFSASNQEAFTSLENARASLDLMERRAARLSAGIEEGGFGPNSSPARRLANLQKEIELQRQKVALAERQQKIMEDFRAGRPLRVDIEGGGGGGGGSEIGDTQRAQMEAAAEKFRLSLLGKEEALMESHLRQMDQIEQFEAAKIITEQEAQALHYAAAIDYEQKLTAITEAEANKRAQAEAKVQGHITGLKQRGMSLAVGLLRTLGQEHEGAAYAAIALEKALAINQINIEAGKAHMAAYGLLALGTAGPLAVSAMHTQIEASRAFAIGMTVATGLAEAANVSSSGGGGIGASGAPTPVQPVDNPIAPTSVPADGGPAQGNQITVLIKGEGVFDDMVRNSVEVLSANDELVIVRG